MKQNGVDNERDGKGISRPVPERDVAEARIIGLPKIPDNRGNLSFVEELSDLPFSIARAYWIYDVPGGENRGGHAFRENEELIIALSGAFDVVLSDGVNESVHTLNRSYYGLYVPNGIWREMRNFSTNSVALVLASRPYDTADYIWDMENPDAPDPDTLQ